MRYASVVLCHIIESDADDDEQTHWISDDGDDGEVEEQRQGIIIGRNDYYDHSDCHDDDDDDDEEEDLNQRVRDKSWG